MPELLKRIIILLCFVIFFATMWNFRHYIEKQSPLDMDKLNEMVEKELIEIYGKN